MVQAMRKFLSSAAEFWHDYLPAQTAVPAQPAEKVYKIGEYKANYAPLTPAEMAMVDPVTEELFRKSKPVP